MDIQSYINSGRIEHYVLGLSSPEDAREIERFAEQYPAFRAEIEAVQDALGQFANAQAIQPPADLKARILTEIERLAAGQPEKPRVKPVEAAPKIDKAVPPPPPDGFVRQKPAGFPFGWLVAGLMTLVAGYFLYTSNDLNAQLKAAQLQADEATKRLEAVEKDCSEAARHHDKLQKQFVFVQDAATKSLEMKGVAAKSPASLVVVLSNETKRQNFLDIRSLPAPPTGKQYQLWAIKGDQKISMGVFDLPKTAGEFVDVPFVDAPDAYAVTLENAGGVASPTLEEMYVVGAVEKPKPRFRRNEG